MTKSRRTAIAVFVVVVVVFGLLGCHRSLSRRVREVEDIFFSQQLTAPATQLNEAAKYANRILSAINGAVDDAVYTAVADSRRDLLDALEARSIDASYEAAMALAEAVDRAAQAAEGKALDSVEDLDSLLSDFDGALRVACNGDYNLAVEQFMNTVANRFPTNILRHLALVAMPESFEGQ